MSDPREYIQNLFQPGQAGPPSPQYATILLQILGAINGLADVWKGSGTGTMGPLSLVPTPAPSPPTSGAVIYVDNSTGALTVVKPDGTRTVLA